MVNKNIYVATEMLNKMIKELKSLSPEGTLESEGNIKVRMLLKLKISRVIAKDCLSNKNSVIMRVVVKSHSAHLGRGQI